jgi:glycosyltransferase involved in cell wall biosynthesis
MASYNVPQDDRDCGSRRLFDFVCFLRAAGWGVDFIAANGLGEPRYARALRQMGVAVHDDSPQQRWSNESAPSERLERLVRGAAFDVALFAFWPVAELYLPLVRRLSPDTRVMVDSIDLHFLREARRIFHRAPAGTGETGETAEPLLTMDYAEQLVGELNTYAAADLVLTVSQKEANLLRDVTSDPLLAEVVPVGEDMPPSPIPLEQRSGILFLGSFQHPPNLEALEYLMQEVLPRVDRRLLQRHPVHVVGNGLDDAARRIAEGIEHVRLVGWVPSVLPYFHRSRISVIPLLYGAGTKGKLIQALLTATPTVSTSIGTEGLDLRDEAHVLIADDPDRFAQAIERLLCDDSLWGRLASSGRECILRTHGREVVRSRFLQLLDVVLARNPRPAILPESTRESYHRRLAYLTRPRGAGPSRRPHSRETCSPNGHDTTSPIASGGPCLAEAPAQPVVADRPAPPRTGAPRLIAFYLPQYHPIPENDRWWGEGFTDWRNVARAQPLFPGHHQPQLPADLGFYDLRLTETREEQAELARSFGIHGFCYYHYWFHGKRLLEQPFNAVLRSGKPDFPFCLCWANEPWSRRWDGTDTDVLQPQSYSAEDDLNHIRWLLDVLADPRAITINERPVFIVYQGHRLPEPARTTDLWRSEAERAGLKAPYLMAVESHWDGNWDATQVGFDAKVLFQPLFPVLSRVERLDVPNPRLRVYDYQKAWPLLANPEPVPYLRYDTVFPSWDNTPRRGEDGWVLHNSTPEAYEQWLRLALERTLGRPPGQRVVFLNAWNEWAEGCHLEPDRRDGLAYLKATRAALDSLGATDATGAGQPSGNGLSVVGDKPSRRAGEPLVLS